MISNKLLQALNEQINKELYSAYLYLAMAAYSASIGLNGFANWFSVQVKEELTHAEKFYNYVNQQSGRVVLKAVAQPAQDFSSTVELFKQTLEHEKNVSKIISGLVDLAKKENSYATEAFLQWFVTEQVEEEASATEILQKLNLVGKDGQGLLMVDSQLATRVFIPAQTN